MIVKRIRRSKRKRKKWRSKKGTLDTIYSRVLKLAQNLPET